MRQTDAVPDADASTNLGIDGPEGPVMYVLICIGAKPDMLAGGAVRAQVSALGLEFQ
jgi:hypothetical protein